MRQFFKLVASLCFAFAAMALVGGLINVVFGTHIGLGRGSSRTPLPNDLAGVIAVTDMILIVGVLAQLAAGPKVMWAWMKGHRLISVLGFAALFVAPAGYVGMLASRPDSIRVAIKAGRNPKALDTLLAQGANVNERDEQGLPLLSYAMNFSSPDAIDKLLKAGADVDALDRYGRTPLMHCLAYRRISKEDTLVVVRALLDQKAKTSIVDKSGKSTADYAKGAASDLKAPELVSLIH